MEKCAILLMHIALLGSAAAQNDGEIRLLGGTVAGEGRVEIYHNGEWGTVCDDRWDINDAAVVCRQLGYREASGAPGSAYFGRGNTTQTIWLDEVACSGSEQRLSDCQFDGWFNHDCTHWEDAGVICGNLVSEGDVRLSGGSNPREGRVEVYSGGQWGTVCSDSYWSDTDAQVVCRQLGFESGTTSYANYGSTQGLPVLLTSVICYGSEDKLSDCYHNAELIYCPLNTPAGIKCYGGLYGNETETISFT
ncbi:neurotrypsin-like [Diadema antillarum]|uniref:neurotrypsin-like n=1 Tax=Diadema antillarum TaxID=105358 RepID=UPI003A855476